MLNGCVIFALIDFRAVAISISTTTPKNQNSLAIIVPLYNVLVTTREVANNRVIIK